MSVVTLAAHGTVDSNVNFLNAVALDYINELIERMEMLHGLIGACS